MLAHAIVWGAVALATALIPALRNPTPTELALMAAAAYLVFTPFRRNPLVRRVKRVATAARAVRRAL